MCMCVFAYYKYKASYMDVTYMHSTCGTVHRSMHSLSMSTWCANENVYMLTTIG